MTKNSKLSAPAASPANQKAFAVFNSGFFLVAYPDQKSAEYYVKNNLSDSPEVEIREISSLAASPSRGNEADETRNSKVLASFVEYCQANPGHRFWQALRNWSGYHFILAAEADTGSSGWDKERDTFNWEGKRHDQELAALPSTPEETASISLEVYQQDWVPGFAAFLDDGTLRETGKAHLMINIGSLLSCVESGELPPKDFPYMVAETLMHEAIHALEAWAKVEFSEEKVEELLQKYRRQYRPDGETHWQHDPKLTRDNSNQFAGAAPSSVTPPPGDTLLNQAILEDLSNAIRSAKNTQAGEVCGHTGLRPTGKPLDMRPDAPQNDSEAKQKIAASSPSSATEPVCKKCQGVKRIKKPDGIGSMRCQECNPGTHGDLLYGDPASSAGTPEGK
jgi:hypothetical protein